MKTRSEAFHLVSSFASTVRRQRPRRVAGGREWSPAGHAAPWDHFLMLITLSM
jgi:hypothetical protein